MRTQVTRKKLSENYYCVSVGYCELQHLLSYESSPYYTAGIYGWNFDAYVFTYNGMNVAITTGYRSLINNCKNNCTYEICKKYDNKAREILQGENDSTRARILLERLIADFLGVVFTPLEEARV